MKTVNIARARAALMSISADLPHDEWFKAICSAKAAGLSLDDVDDWSSTAKEKYKGRQDVERTFRNITPVGGITKSTLFHMAKQYGSFLETSNRRQERFAPAINNQRSDVNKSIRTGPEIIADILAACEPATPTHPYIRNKLGLPDGLLVYKGQKTICGQNCNGALVLTLSDLDGNKVAAQFIPLDGDKVFPRGIKLPQEACLVMGGTLAQTKKSYIVEGIGQAWSVHLATGAPAVVCFGKGRLAGVAKAIHAKYPDLILIIVPDAEPAHASC